jgi:methyl-accepting chemotaxis protein
MPLDIAESLALAGIDDSTRALLRETWPLIREGASYALQAAYAPANGKHPAPGQPTREQLEAARIGQAKHWEALFAATFDAAYVASLREVATIHAKVGLDPRWLISGNVTTLTELHSLVMATHCTSMMSWAARSRMERVIRAVDQAVLFDLQMSIVAYTEQREEMALDKLKQLAQRFQSQAGATMETAQAQSPDGRRSANELFRAAQRRTFRAATADQGPGLGQTAAPVAAYVPRVRETQPASAAA